MNVDAAAFGQVPLAAGLSNPWMLPGLLLAAIPILIHLFYRRRYAEVRWGAVLFLSKAVRRNAQRNRFQQLLLLILRTLAIVLLVVGFARPLLDSGSFGVADEQPTLHILVLDDSLSMRATSDGQSRFDRAIQIALRIVEVASEDDQFQIVRTSGLSASPAVAAGATDREAAARTLGAIACTARACDVSAALAEVERVLTQSDGDVLPRVYLLSDLPTDSWGPVDASSKAAIASLAAAAEVSVINVADDTSDNVTVKADDIVGAALVDQPVLIQGTVTNFGSQPVVRTIRLAANDRPLATQPVEVPAGREQPFQFEFTPRVAGPHRLLIETGTDSLAEDNRFRLVVNAFDQLPVLLVNGRPSSEPLGNATDFLRLSLAPGGEATGNAPWSVNVVNEAEFSSLGLAKFGIVFLCDIRQFTRQETLKLKRYAESGGAIVLCPGDRADIGNYNSRLLGDGGLLPVRLDQFVGNALKPKGAFGFDTKRLSHPVVSLYRGNPGYGLQQVLSFRYLRAVPDGQMVRTALAFENGDPVIVEGPCGSGHVALITMTADRTQWSTWNTASGTYATLMNELSRFLASRTKSSSSEIVGEPWLRRVPIGNEEVSVTSADSEPVPIVVERTDSVATVLVDPVEEPGFIRASSGPTDQWVAVNVVTSESNLRTVAEAELRTGLPTATSLAFANAEQFVLDPLSNRVRSQDRLSVWLFVLVVGLLLSEQLLASRASRSAWLVLVGLGAIAIVLLNLPTQQSVVVLASGVVVSLAIWRWFGRLTPVRANEP